MAERAQATVYDARSAVSAVEDDRWPVPQTAMFVTLASAGLWALIVAALGWLIG